MSESELERERQRAREAGTERDGDRKEMEERLILQHGVFHNNHGDEDRGSREM